MPFGSSGVGRVGCHWCNLIPVNKAQQALGTQEISHPLLPGAVVHTVEEGDKLGDIFGRHFDVVSRRNQQSAKDLNAQNSEKYDSTVYDGGTMPVAK